MFLHGISFDSNQTPTKEDGEGGMVVMVVVVVVVVINQ